MKKDAPFHWLSNIYYLLIGLSLIAIAGLATWVSVRDIYLAAQKSGDYTLALLNSAGLIVLALAIFDVGKYLIEEEVLRTRELRETSEARQSLTKFMAILLIALGLESLVFVFKAGHSAPEHATRDSMQNLLYPAILVMAIAVLLLALGWYQRLSIRAEVTEKGELPLAKRGALPLNQDSE